MTRAKSEDKSNLVDFSPSVPADGDAGEDYVRMRKENLLSFVVVCSGKVTADVAEIETISRFAKDRFDFYEILVAASVPTAGWRSAMRELGIRIANTRIITIDAAMNYEELSTTALRHAIGDYVVSLYPGEISEADIERMVKLCAAGTHDMVKTFHQQADQSVSERLAASMIRRMIWLATGHEIQAFQARAFALNRTALSRLQAVGGALKFFRLLDLSGHLSEGRIVVKAPVKRRLLGTFAEKLRMAAVLVSTSASRLVLSLALICFALSVLSVLAAFIALVIWIFKEDIAPGWTSLTIVFSLLFGANFGVLAAICLGLLQLIRQGAPDAVDLFTSELSGGDFFHNSNRLNVDAGTSVPYEKPGEGV